MNDYVKVALAAVFKTDGLDPTPGCRDEWTNSVSDSNPFSRSDSLPDSCIYTMCVLARLVVVLRSRHKCPTPHLRLSSKLSWRNN